MRTIEITGLERNIAVLKLSSEMVLNDNEIGVSEAAVEYCADKVAEVNEEFHPLIVLGGAVGAGKAYLLELGEDPEGVDQQVLASYGTPRVSTAVQKALAKRGIKSGQVLANHNRMHAGSTLMQGILNGIVSDQNAYHINENDQENLYELSLLEEERKTVREKPIGIDNDPMAGALTKALVEELKAQGLAEELACYLVMFTRIGGMVIGDEVQPEISASKREEVYGECIGARPGGSGGMRVKVEACFEAYDAGAKSVYIASPAQNWLEVVKGSGEVGKVTKVVQ